jgi:hypothetical protein
MHVQAAVRTAKNGLSVGVSIAYRRHPHATKLRLEGTAFLPERASGITLHCNKHVQIVSVYGWTGHTRRTLDATTVLISQLRTSAAPWLIMGTST